MVARRVALLVLCFGVWFLLVWSTGWQEVVFGFGAAVLAAIFFGNIFPVGFARLLNPVRWFWLLVYVPVFVWQCLRANVDVALRVLAPGLELRPGIVRIRTSLKSDIARVFLANSITLTPGTMSVELVGDTLYIHWIEVTTDDPDAAARRIIGPFEFFLKRIFD